MPVAGAIHIDDGLGVLPDNGRNPVSLGCVYPGYGKARRTIGSVKKACLTENFPCIPFLEQAICSEQMV